MYNAMAHGRCHVVPLAKAFAIQGTNTIWWDNHKNHKMPSNSTIPVPTK